MNSGLTFLATLSICMSMGTPSSTADSRIPHVDGRSAPKLLFADSVATTAHPLQSPESIALAYLADNHSVLALPPDASNLRLTLSRESLLGTHLYFQQYIGDIPVDKAEVIVSLHHKEGRVFRVFNNTFPISKPMSRSSAIVGTNSALDRAWEHLQVRGRLLSLPAVEQVYVPSGGDFRLAYRTIIYCDAPYGQWEQYVDAESGAIISSRDRLIRDQHGPSKTQATGTPSRYSGSATGTLRVRAAVESEFLAQYSKPPSAKSAGPVNKTTVNGTARVFDPDPKTTLMSDTLSNISPASAFSNAYVTRVLQDISLEAGVYALVGPWVTITNFDLPNTAHSTTPNGNWIFPRGSNGFNDAMTYFHLDQSQRYMQSLGYTNSKGIQFASIRADTDGANGDDNSFYDPNDNTLTFGHGGVDDNEDADVILHEYGHAIQFSINPSWDGGDTGGMGEGFGDYWAASYRYSTSNGPNFHPTWFAPWDGHNVFWGGRDMDSTGQYDASTNYDAHVTVLGVYSDELWSTPLYQSMTNLIARGRPRTEVDTIMLESHFGLGSGLTMRDMARVIVQTAQELYPTGIHAQVIHGYFTNRAILITPLLANPTLIRPTGGEHAKTGSVIGISWLAPAAPPSAVVTAEYTAMLSAGGPWIDLASTGVMQVSYPWTVPATAGTNYGVRIKLSGADMEASAWVTGSAITLSTDTDSDGIPDSWEQLQYGNLGSANSTSDSDGDGHSDLKEFRAGTNPTNAQSSFMVATFSNTTASNTISWQSVSNRLYRLSRSTNLLSSFASIASNLISTPPSNTFLDVSASNQIRVFYRISVQP